MTPTDDRPSEPGIDPSIRADRAIAWLAEYLRTNDRLIRARVRSWRNGHEQRIGGRSIVLPPVAWLSEADVEDVISTANTKVCQHYRQGRFEPRCDPALFSTTLVLQAATTFRQLVAASRHTMAAERVDVTTMSGLPELADPSPSTFELVLAQTVQDLRPGILVALSRATALTAARWSALQIVTGYRPRDNRTLPAIRTAAKDARTVVVETVGPVLRDRFGDEVTFATGSDRVRDVHDFLELLGLLVIEYDDLRAAVLPRQWAAS